jgi:hypothetical protein
MTNPFISPNPPAHPQSFADILNNRSRESVDNVEAFQDLVYNVLSARREFIQQLLDPRRDYDEECGYPKGYVQPQVYQDLFDREPIPNRVVSCLPKESWQVQPRVYEDEDTETVTEFEKAWDGVGRMLRGPYSHYKEEEGSPIWDYTLRGDILSGIGHYGIMLLGIDDGKPLDQPVDGVDEAVKKMVADPETEDGEEQEVQGYSQVGYGNYAISGYSAPYGGSIEDESDEPTYRKADASRANGKTRKASLKLKRKLPPGMKADASKAKRRRLLYVRVFPESLAVISVYDSDRSSPRYMQPVRYTVTLNDPSDAQAGIGMSTATVEVHWTRVIHLADNLLSSEVHGVPRQRPVLNRLLDLRKLYGGSAEMYWRGALPGYSFETHPELGGEVKINEQKHRDMVEAWANGLQRYMTLMGMTAKSLAPQVVEPSAQIEVQIEAICIQLGIPVRVFKGSERGELASSQDDAAWNDRLRARQKYYITPRIIVPLVDRLILMGVLPVPNYKPPAAKADASKSKPDENTGDEIAPGEPSDTEDTNAEEEGTAASPPRFRMPSPSVNAQVDGEQDDSAVTDNPSMYDDATGEGDSATQDDTTDDIEEEEDEEPGYCIWWPDLTSQTQSEKATVAQGKTTAMATYISGGLESLMTPMDFLTRILEFTEEEAEAIILNAEKAAAKKQEEEQQQLEEQRAHELKMADTAGVPVGPDGMPQQPGQPPMQPGQQPNPAAAGTPFGKPAGNLPPGPPTAPSVGGARPVSPQFRR